MAQPGRKKASPRMIERGSRLADALRESRNDHDWSQTTLAQRSGVEADTLRKIEAHKTSNPGFLTVADLAHALGLSVEDLAARTRISDPLGG